MEQNKKKYDPGKNFRKDGGRFSSGRTGGRPGGSKEQSRDFATDKRSKADDGDVSLVVGRNAVSELLKSGRDINKIFVKKGERTGSIVVIAAKAIEMGIPLIEVEGSKLDTMAGGMNHQGVIASAAIKEYVSVDEILKIAEEKGERPFIVIADGIEDPQNLGALIRVCEGNGVHGIIIPKRRAVGLTASAGRASAGAFELVPIAQVTNLASVVDDLKEKGIWIYAAEAGGETIYDCDMDRAACIIVGAEGKGVSRLLCDKSDYIVSIPMYGSINSFNVSSAAAVVLCEASRQRNKTNSI